MSNIKGIVERGNRKRKPSFKTKEIETGFHVWSQIAKEHKVKREHIGKRVWVAGEFKTKERYLRDVHSKGSKGWPDGGFSVYEPERGFTRYYPLQKVRLHPSEYTKRRIRK